MLYAISRCLKELGTIRHDNNKSILGIRQNIKKLGPLKSVLNTNELMTNETAIVIENASHKFTCLKVYFHILSSIIDNGLSFTVRF